MKIFTETKRIVSKKGILHFTRYAIIETKLFSIYLHRVYMADEDEHPHNHPWTWCKPFRISGKYLELFATLKDPTLKIRVGGKTAMVQTDYHKIHSVLDKPVISLFLAGKRVDDWGYLTASGHVDHKTYRIQKQMPTGKLYYFDTPSYQTKKSEK